MIRNLLRSGARYVAVTLALATATLSAEAADNWLVDMSKSRLGFQAIQAGKTFDGTFESWSATIAFDPADLPGSKVAVLVDTTKISTGDPQRDANLPTPNWFGAENFPKAFFNSESFKSTGENAYEAAGTLTVRDATETITLPFTLKIEGDMAVMSGRAAVMRSNFGIGKGVPAEMVGEDVTVIVEVTAKRAN